MSSTQSGEKSNAAILGVKVGLECPECGSTQVHLNFGQAEPGTLLGSLAKPPVAWLVCRACGYESVRVEQADAFVLVGWDVVVSALRGGDKYRMPEVRGTVLHKLAGMFGWKVWKED